MHSELLDNMLLDIPKKHLKDYKFKLTEEMYDDNYVVYKVDDNIYDIDLLIELKLSRIIYDEDLYEDKILVYDFKKFIDIITKFTIAFKENNKIYIGFKESEGEKILDAIEIYVSIIKKLDMAKNSGIRDSIIEDDDLVEGSVIKTGNNLYIIIGYIGQGSYGKVYKAYDKNNEYVAIKEVLNIINIELFVKEFNILKKIQDNNCRKDIACPRDIFKNSVLDKIYIVTDFINGKPLNEISTNCSYNCFIDVIFKILDALKFINKKGIIHGDIKPENILCIYSNNKYYPVLIDFGLSCMVENCQTSGGSLFYMAPEFFTKKVLYKNSDIWSLGITLYTSIIGDPFEGIDDETFSKKIGYICDKSTEIKIPKFNTDSSLLNNLSNDMLICNYKHRMDAEELLNKYRKNI